MQDADDFDKSGSDRAEEDYMNGITDRGLAAFVAAVPDMKAPNTGEKFAAVDRRWSHRLDRDAPHRCRQKRAVADARLDSMQPLAGAQH